MESLRIFFATPAVRRIVVLLLLVGLLYSLRHMLNLILLLFLVTYVMNRLQGLVTRWINRAVPVHPIVVAVLLYVLLLSGLAWGISNYVPQLVTQGRDMINTIIRFLNSTEGNDISKRLSEELEKIDYKTYVDQAFLYLGKIGKMLELVLIVILLSFFFLLQKAKIRAFTQKFQKSKIGWVYDEIAYFSERFVSSFGKVIEVQLVIALFNTVFTMLGLWIMGYPYLFALTIIVFLLSLVPVAGVIISFVPISIIGYQAGGITLVFWVIVMILLIHALEAYVLNPRLMASKTKLPMFYTFVILVFSQHYFGIWGLIIGIPVFMFVLDILHVPLGEEKNKEA
ncbi:AI-2E family transporter [Paenibacillus albicereus]|uniref:AI-2E family transporter n=1 Tax=Paenibacillus albicereus TaxID=2726185 RepID=A0A6H2GVJ2_9BACL|nr:AI-2E family transporter [Paenibacillus albicereus]QJC51415.1 AI-2E family transporter [Paenibacillus albicereus]